MRPHLTAFSLLVRILLLLTILVVGFYPSYTVSAQAGAPVTFYQYYFYGGWSWTAASAGAYNMPYTDASSLILSPGYTICLYSDFNLAGNSGCVTSDWCCFSLINGWDANDNVRSFIVYKEPTTTITNQPPNPSNNPNPTFAFSGTGIDVGIPPTFVCKIDSGLYAACTSGSSFGPLADGVHTFTVIATGLVGPVQVGDLTPASYTWTIDATPPTVTIDQAAGQADPTNQSPIQFDVLFSEAVTGFAASDVSISGVAGTPVVNVSGTGPGYTVSVTGMVSGETVVAAVNANAAQDAAGNGSSASTSTDNSVLYDAAVPTVTIDQAVGQADPTNQSPIQFDVLFSEAVTGFAASDISISGVAGTPVVNVSGAGPGYTVSVTGMVSGETVVATVKANAAQDASGNASSASTSLDNSVTYDTTGIRIVPNGIVGQPVNIVIKNGGEYTERFNQLTITFTEEADNPAGSTATDDVTNPQNYLLVQRGLNGIYDTLSCAGGLQGDDDQVVVNSVSYINHGGAGPFTASLQLNNGLDLPNGQYRLFVCGTTSIVDRLGNPLNNGADDVSTFTLAQALTLPQTGFPMGRVTDLPAQPRETTYAPTSLTLEIPTLGRSMQIVGVPQSEQNWDVSWLGDSAGWLSGSAFPSWSGNSILTGHVWDALNRPGPFAGIKNLRYGDTILVHAFGSTYVFAVRENRLVQPADRALVFTHKESPWLTLVTCEAYDAQNDQYLYRRMVRAVLVEIR